MAVHRPGAEPTTVVIDSSALMCRYLGDRRSEVLDRAMSEADQVVVTALARTEVAMAVHLALGGTAAGGAVGTDVQARMADDWDRFWVVPLDGRCLFRAAEIGSRFGLNLTNAMHLAALDRVPRPARYLTIDDRQVVAAEALGFDIVVVDVDETTATAHGLLA